MFCYFDVCVFANKSRKMLCEHLLISLFALFSPKVPRTFSPRNYPLRRWMVPRLHTPQRLSKLVCRCMKDQILQKKLGIVLVLEESSWGGKMAIVAFWPSKLIDSSVKWEVCAYSISYQELDERIVPTLMSVLVVWNMELVETQLVYYRNNTAGSCCSWYSYSYSSPYNQRHVMFAFIFMYGLNTLNTMCYPWVSCWQDCLTLERGRLVISPGFPS